MNLYKVACIYKGMYTNQSFFVYVSVKDPFNAEILALNWMKENKYKYDSYVGTIELIASTDKNKAPSIFIVQDLKCGT